MSQERAARQCAGSLDEATLCGGLAWSRQSRQALRSLSERTTRERLVRPGADDPNRWTKGVRVAGQLGLLLVVRSRRLAEVRDTLAGRRLRAETVSGNAARLGRSVHLCLYKTPGQDRLAALPLLVRGDSQLHNRWHCCFCCSCVRG
jgi:hypothetical protein